MRRNDHTNWPVPYPLTLALALLLACGPTPVGADCPDGPSSFAPTVPNVIRSLGNNVTACPAGDTTRCVAT